MRVDWTEEAEADLDKIVDYFATFSVDSAVAMDARIRNRVRLLADYPLMGRIGRYAGTRELIIPRDKCVVVYRVQVETVEIATLIHGGQEWDDAL